MSCRDPIGRFSAVPHWPVLGVPRGGASVYGFSRIPETWEFELAGYTNVSGGMKTDTAGVAADRAAALYYANSGMRSAETVRRDNARSSMTISGPNRLIKVKPLLGDPTDTYPPGEGIPQWRVSELAAARGTLQGRLLFLVQPGERYPI